MNDSIVQQSKVSNTESKNNSKAGSIEKAVNRIGTTIQVTVTPDFKKGIYRHPTSGEWLADIIVLDPVTRQTITIEGIKLNGADGRNFMKVDNNTIFKLNIEDVANIAAKNTTGMNIDLVQGTMRSENKHVPIKNLSSNYRATSVPNVNGKRRMSCRLGGFNFKEASSKMHEYTGLSVFANPSDPNSGGTLIDSTRGEIVLFKGKQKMVMGKQGIAMSGSAFNTGGMKRKKESTGTGGLSSNENGMREMVPASNILLNVPIVIPPYIPSFIDIVRGMSLLYKIIKVGQLASEKLKNHNAESCSAAQKRRNKARKVESVKSKINKARKKTKKYQLKLRNEGIYTVMTTTTKGKDSPIGETITSTIFTLTENTGDNKGKIVYKLEVKVANRPITLFSGSISDKISNAEKLIKDTAAAKAIAKIGSTPVKESAVDKQNKLSEKAKA